MKREDLLRTFDWLFFLLLLLLLFFLFFLKMIIFNQRLCFRSSPNSNSLHVTVAWCCIFAFLSRNGHFVKV